MLAKLNLSIVWGFLNDSTHFASMNVKGLKSGGILMDN